MTLQDALKSGKLFKLPHQAEWYDPEDVYTFTMVEVLADNWEIQRTPREWSLYKQDGQWKVAEELTPGLVVYRGNAPTEVIKVREVLG